MRRLFILLAVVFVLSIGVIYLGGASYMTEMGKQDHGHTHFDAAQGGK